LLTYAVSSIRLGSMRNRENPPQTIIPLAVFSAMLAARVQRVKREQAEIARAAYWQDNAR
jgi:hypothetical protein